MPLLVYYKLVDGQVVATSPDLLDDPGRLLKLKVVPPGRCDCGCGQKHGGGAVERSWISGDDNAYTVKMGRPTRLRRAS